MKKQITFLNIGTFLAALICCFAFSNAFAASNQSDEITRSLIVGNLSARLKTDLAQPRVSVKLSSVERHAISKTTIEIKGDGVCVCDSRNNQLPIRFEAKVNVVQKTVSSISYDFVEAFPVTPATAAPVADYAPTSNEEFLMKELMKQVSKDYNTDNIVIALDTVEGGRISLGERVFTGVGEIRVGDLQWNKIKFDVSVNGGGKATKVVYDLKK